MNTINTQIALPFAWLFVSMTAIFALALWPKLAVRFYPESPNLGRRFAAPVIFALLAAACYLGAAIQTLAAVTLFGLILIVIQRRRGRGQA